jgi:hypothetical protein
LERSGCITSDTLNIRDEKIEKSADFEEELFDLAIKTAQKVNPCLIIKQ